MLNVFTLLSYLFRSLFHPGDFLFWLRFSSKFLKSLIPFTIYGFILPSLVVGFISFFSEDDFFQLFRHGMKLTLLTETLTNLHTFLIIVPNHAGYDMPIYTEECQPHSDEYLLRAILSSANFDSGNDLIDIFHGGLNYQIEHHLFPNLSCLKYRKMQPKIRQLCKEYGIHYCQESVLKRLYETLAIVVGTKNPKFVKSVT